MSDKTKAIIIISAMVLLFISGFFIGRGNIRYEEKVTTEYIKGDAVIDSIPTPVPYKVIIKPDTLDILKACIEKGIYSELFPSKVITEKIIPTKDDTLAILSDYIALRKYSEVLFDNDSIGKMIVNTDVQYNRIDSYSYEYTPVYKVVTREVIKAKKISPYAGINATIDGGVGVHGGVYFNDKYGIGIIAERLDEKNRIGASLSIKF